MMPAMNSKRPALDIQKDFMAHIDANKRAHEWAARCLELRAAGKLTRAKAAEAKATGWLRRVLLLEARSGTGKPAGERLTRKRVICGYLLNAK
jgi:hypothetical protein